MDPFQSLLFSEILLFHETLLILPTSENFQLSQPHLILLPEKQWHNNLSMFLVWQRIFTGTDEQVTCSKKKFKQQASSFLEIYQCAIVWNTPTILIILFLCMSNVLDSVPHLIHANLLTFTIDWWGLVSDRRFCYLDILIQPGRRLFHLMNQKSYCSLKRQADRQTDR